MTRHESGQSSLFHVNASLSIESSIRLSHAHAQHFHLYLYHLPLPFSRMAWYIDHLAFKAYSPAIKSTGHCISLETPFESWTVWNKEPWGFRKRILRICDFLIISHIPFLQVEELLSRFVKFREIHITVILLRVALSFYFGSLCSFFIHLWGFCGSSDIFQSYSPGIHCLAILL